MEEKKLNPEVSNSEVSLKPVQEKEKEKKQENAVTRKKRLTPFQLEKIAAIKGYKLHDKVKKRYYSFQRKTVNASKVTTSLFNELSNGPLVVSGIKRNEVKKFDKSFIDEIARVLPSLENIVMNPHKFITEFSEIVQVEKARKITPRAVKHMAKNSKDISEVLEGGKVVPKNVLNVFVDDDLVIYENRFIMTLIRRLQIFIELRYKYIQDHGDTKNSDQITINKKVKMGDVSFEFDGKVKISVPSDDDGNRQENIEILETLAALRKRTMFLVNSRFMADMRRATPVTNPIKQTNIIRLNYAYQDAYRLWLFINRYDELGISYKTTQVKANFDEDYLEKINHLVMSAFLSIQTEHIRVDHQNIVQKHIKPVVKPGVLDFELSDDRFLEHGLPIKVTTRVETPEQKAARLKKQESKEKAAAKKELKKALEKQRALLKKQRAKEKARLAKIAEKEKAKQRALDAKMRQQEKNAERERIRKEKEAIIAERKAGQLRLQEEARLLKQARLNVARVAKEDKNDGRSK